MEKRSSSRLAEWLDGLAQESWQLELIISGFAIFLLVGIYEPLRGLGDQIEGMGLSWQWRNMLNQPYMILLGAWFILLINLCIHVLLRGLWISTVGLRSVSDDIDFDSLRLRPRFDRFLRRRIGSFDRYIERLERICSVLFAFTFLILFMLLAVGGMIALMSGLNLLLRDGLDLGNHPLVDVINGLFLLAGLVYFLDFVAMARLKRVRWLEPVYYPVYRFYSLVTLAPLYRPIYYNLIDNRFGRGVGLLLVPYLIFLMVASSLTLVTDAYFPETPGNHLINTAYYDDQRPESAISHWASIPSRYVRNGFLELFLPYHPSRDNAPIKALCPELEEANRTGIALRGVITIHDANPRANIDTILFCISRMHRLFIDDSLQVDPPFRFYTHPQRGNNGLLAILDVQYLPRGEHLLQVETRRTRSDSLYWISSAVIPFWKE